MKRRAVAVVGIGDDGCASLTSRAMSRSGAAQVLVGGARHLAFFPQLTCERIGLDAGIGAALDRVAALAEDHDVCILASGDPLWFGIGSLVIKRLGAEHVEIVPQPSAAQLAFARIGLPWSDATLLSVHGRPLEGLATRLRRIAKAAVLTDEESSPARIAAHLIDHGDTAWSAWVGEHLGGAGERVRQFELAGLARATDIAPLNVLVLARRDPSWRPPPVVPCSHEDAFAKRMPKKGLITKREVRLLSLAALQLRPTSVVWDVGAGSGSVSIEAAQLASEGRVYAVEVDPEGVAICRDNARAHGVDNVRVIAGRAPEALIDLEPPDAVFIGGSKGSMADIIDVALDRLRPGGRIVATAITLENAHEAYQSLRRHALVPEVTLVQVSRAEPLAHYHRFEAQNPIQLFAATKPATENS